MADDPRRARALRLGLAALVLVDLIRLVAEIGMLRDPAYLGIAAGWVGHLAETTWACVALGVIAATGAWRWGRHGAQGGGATALVGLACLGVVHSYVRGEHDESLFFSGVLLAGWLLTEAAAARPMSAEERARWGCRGALAFLAGVYMTAALAKLGSASWWTGENVRLALAMSLDIDPTSVCLPLRQWMAQTGWVHQCAAVVTVVVQLGAVLLVAGPRLRALAGTALWCFHLALWACLGVVFPEPLVLLPLMTWRWSGRELAIGRWAALRDQGSPWPGLAVTVGAVAVSMALGLHAGPAAPVFAALYAPQATEQAAGEAVEVSDVSESQSDWLAELALGRAQDSTSGGLGALFGPSGEGAKRWGCDAGHLPEGREGTERLGCFVPLPGVYLRQLLHSPPERAATVDPHTFLMGAQSADPTARGFDPEADQDESPVHRVTLSSFWMHRTAVSVRQFQLCVRFGPCERDHVATGGDFTYPRTASATRLLLLNRGNENPVTGVTWEGARSFCEWLGARLPTEAEWEFAARGGALQLRYPWGEARPTCRHATYGGGPQRACGREGPQPVPSRAPAGHATHSFILNQAGNTWEWTADWYDAGFYALSPVQDPTGPTRGQGRVVRGGSWSDDDPTVLRAAYRAQMDPTLKMPDIGFRCAADEMSRRPTTLLDAFDGPAGDGWTPLGPSEQGEWTTAGGMLRGEPGEGGVASLWRRDPITSSVALSVRVFSAVGPTGSVSVLYGVQAGGGHYRAELYPRAGVARIVRVIGGTEGQVAEKTGLRVPDGSWLTLTITWKDGHHRFNFGAVDMAARAGNEVAGDEGTWASGGFGVRVCGPGSAHFAEVFTTP